MPSQKRQKIEDDGNESPEELIVDFEAFPPGEGDWNGIKMLLNQLFPTAPIDHSGLADLLVKQSPVGCLFKASEECAAEEFEDAVYGVVSLTDFTSKNACVNSFREYVHKLCEEHASENTKKCILPCLEAGAKTAFIWSERFLNIPYKIAYPAFMSLKGDLDNSKNGFVFDHFVLVMKGNKNGDETLFTNSEEEFLEEVCPAGRSFTYDVREPTEDEWQPIRRVVVFQRTHLDSFIQKLEDL